MQNRILTCHDGCTIHGHGTAETIGLEYIASMLVKANFDCNFRSNQELYVSGFESRHKGIALFSSITSEYPQVLEAAKAAKQRGEITILGGYHACGCTDKIEPDLFDYVVIGEGEQVAVALANAILHNEISEIISFKDNGVSFPRIIRVPRIEDLDSIPFPLRSEERMSRYQYHLHDLMWPSASRQHNSTLILASRGCAYDCDFCASSTVWGRGIRLRSPDNVIKELIDIKARLGTNTVVFIDQSLGQAKQWTLKLCNAIQEADIGMNWYHQSNLNIDLDVVREMAKAGCTKIGFGLEGISPRAVERIKPINPYEFDAVNSLFDYCNTLGIFVKAYLMIGFPWETKEIIEEYFEWVPRIRANQIKISYMTPFPGTRDWMKYRDQLVTRNWEDFDTVRMPVIYNKRISVPKYHEIRTALFKSFYGSHTYADVTHQMIRAYPHYIESYREFADYLDRFRMISGDEVWLEWAGHGQASRFAMAGGH